MTKENPHQSFRSKQKRPPRININDAVISNLLAQLAAQDVANKRRSKINMTATLYEILAAEQKRREAQEAQA